MVRLALIGAVLLTVVFVSLREYALAARRETLERQWEAGEASGDREMHVRAGMVAFARRLLPVLILGVYVVPVLIAAVVIWVTN